MSTVPREKLVRLLDYVEQVVRLDERVVFRISEYRLPDKSSFTLVQEETQNLPGVSHQLSDDEGPIWLEVMRLPRKPPPSPPAEISEWIVVPTDPTRWPERRQERIVTVAAVERDAALASAEVRPNDVTEAPRRSDEPADAAPQYDLILRLEDRPQTASAIDAWIADVWTNWAIEELPRRKTISLYQRLYRVFQLLQSSAESPVELIWGIGNAKWEKIVVVSIVL